MSDETPARDPIGEDARIDALEARLQAAREREDQRNRPQVGSADSGYKLGNRVLAELLGGLIGGAAIGLVIDWVIGNGTHWGLMVMLVLGIVVAFRNIIRISSRRPTDPE